MVFLQGIHYRERQSPRLGHQCTEVFVCQLDRARVPRHFRTRTDFSSAEIRPLFLVFPEHHLERRQRLRHVEPVLGLFLVIRTGPSKIGPVHGVRWLSTPSGPGPHKKHN